MTERLIIYWEWGGGEKYGILQLMNRSLRNIHRLCLLVLFFLSLKKKKKKIRQFLILLGTSRGRLPSSDNAFRRLAFGATRKDCLPFSSISPQGNPSQVLLFIALAELTRFPSRLLFEVEVSVALS